MTLDPARAFVALVHHPVLDKHGHIVATALTNLDLHDIARSTRTYGLAGYFIVHPVEAQRRLASRIAAHWLEEGESMNDFRRMAIERVSVVATLDEAREAIRTRMGEAPLVVATSARELSGAVAPSGLDARRPLLLVLGTGWGLAEEALATCEASLRPIRGAGDYNHLSVRSACAILLDRLYGDRED